MKIANKTKKAGRQKSKNQQKGAKSHTPSSASIAAQYIELRQLRERISEAESRLSAR